MGSLVAKPDMEHRCLLLLLPFLTTHLARSVAQYDNDYFYDYSESSDNSTRGAAQYDNDYYYDYSEYSGKEDAVCRYVEDCKRACKTNKEGSFCKGCQVQAAEDRTKPYRERIIDCCRGDLDDICIGRPPPCRAFGTLPLSLSSSVAGQSNRFASGLSQQLAEKTQCDKTTPCKYSENRCGPLVGLGAYGRVLACPKCPYAQCPDLRG